MYFWGWLGIKDGGVYVYLILFYFWINIVFIFLCYLSKKYSLFCFKGLVLVVVLIDGFEDCRGFVVGECCKGVCGFYLSDMGK